MNNACRAAAECFSTLGKEHFAAAQKVFFRKIDISHGVLLCGVGAKYGR